MRKYENKQPQVHTGELRRPVTFFELVPNEGPLPGNRKVVLFVCMAKIDGVWLRDVELAKAHGTLSDITIVIRDPQGDYIPSNKHSVEINALEYKGKLYNIKDAQPDLQNKQFVNVIAKLKS